MASTKRDGKTVFILGAGASYHTHAPVMAKFFPMVRSILRGLSDPRRYQALLDNIGDLRLSAYYTGVNLDNIEDVFSITHLAKETGLDWAPEVFGDLTDLIAETYDLSCPLASSGQWVRPDDLYTEFIRSLVAAVGIDDFRNEALPGALGADVTIRDYDPIITFNYDFMLDYAMTYLGLIPDYGFEYDFQSSYNHQVPRRKWLLLKLHGSVSWGTCRDRCETEQVITPWLPHNGRHKVESPDKRPLKVVSDHVRRMTCSSCKDEGGLHPLIVPPTWAKSPTESGVSEVWRKAIDSLSTATQIIIIGYSLPPTDTVFSYLMTLGLQENRVLSRILVVNPDKTVEERYRQVFAGALSSGRTVRFEPVKFERFIRGEQGIGISPLKVALRYADAPDKRG